MGVLQDFERRLEGAVEGFFARAFRSGLQPVELAKAVQRYAEDTQHVTENGVVVPNVYRFRVSEQDSERLAGYGASLERELAEVVERTASDRGWELRGPVRIALEATDEVGLGRYELAGRVEAGPRPPSKDKAERQPPPPPPPAQASSGSIGVHVDITDASVPLQGARMTVGRQAGCDLVLDDPTVSREHATFVRRQDGWWIVDQGSTNGTRVNGEPRGEHQLSPGDDLRLGNVELRVVEV